jgi:hypothetical protein
MHYTVVGQPLPRPDVPAKCTGRHVYVHDFTLPGMLHARVIRPAAIGGRLLSVDESSIRGIPDVRLVRVESFLALVSADEWAVVTAAAALKTTWGDGRTLPGSEGLDRWTRAAAVDRDQAVVSRGDAVSAIGGAAKTLSATYFWPFQSHASLGPCCAVADVKATARRSGPRRRHARAARQSREGVRPVAGQGARRASTARVEAPTAAITWRRRAVRCQMIAPVRVQWAWWDETG